MNIETTRDFLEKFEKLLNTRNPQLSGIPARVIGYGEISTVLEIGGLDSRFAYKRMPLFRSEDEINRYTKAFENYSRILRESVGLLLPDYSYTKISIEGHPIVFYIAQEMMPAESIGNRAIHFLDKQDCIRLIRCTLRELAKVWRFNAKSEEVEVGIDGQISNWAIMGYNSPPLPEKFDLAYLDTSTPLFRIHGIEQLQAELFLRPAPSFLAWILKRLFLEDVVNRYYDFHLVACDLVANFKKEQKEELIPDLVEETNRFFLEEVPELEIRPISEKEVRSYYRLDAMIWRLYLSLRKLDRFIRTKMLGKDYPYILPGKIKR